MSEKFPINPENTDSSWDMDDLDYEASRVEEVKNRFRMDDEMLYSDQKFPEGSPERDEALAKKACWLNDVASSIRPEAIEFEELRQDFRQDDPEGRTMGPYFEVEDDANYEEGWTAKEKMFHRRMMRIERDAEQRKRQGKPYFTKRQIAEKAWKQVGTKDDYNTPMERMDHRTPAFWSKALEAVFITSVNFGLFGDENSRPAKPIYTSLYDDQLSKVDCAVAIPYAHKNVKGEIDDGYINIALDLTSGVSIENVSWKMSKKPENCAKEIPGQNKPIVPTLTNEVRYAADEKGELIPEKMQMLGYIIGVDTNDVKEALSGDNIEHPSDKLKLGIYRQLRDQSYLKMLYLDYEKNRQDWTETDKKMRYEAFILNKIFDKKCHELQGDDAFYNAHAGERRDSSTVVTDFVQEQINLIRKRHGLE